MASTRVATHGTGGSGGKERYPTAAAYFDALPAGWASFPECRARAALLGGLRARGALDALDALPERLRPLLAHVAEAGDWLPEVVHVGTLLAVRDARFGGRAHADDEFLEWMAQLNRDLLGAPPLAGELSTESPADLVPHLPEIWSMFHAGTPMTVLSRSATAATAALAHPRLLLPALSLESHRRTLALSLAKAGAVAPAVTMRTEIAGDDARTIYAATWR